MNCYYRVLVPTKDTRNWNILDIDESANLLWLCSGTTTGSLTRRCRDKCSATETTNSETNEYVPIKKAQRQMDKFQLFVMNQDPSHLADIVGGTFDLPEKKKPSRTLTFFGKSLCIEQGYSDISKGHSELIWKASLKLPEFFERHVSKISLKGKRILELGSGTGTCGICIAAGYITFLLLLRIAHSIISHTHTHTHTVELMSCSQIKKEHFHF
jgi:hypothetical protein